jgi:hypothetical protein
VPVVASVATFFPGSPMLFFFMRHDFPEKMLEQELRDELKRVLGELPTGPLTKSDLRLS